MVMRDPPAYPQWGLLGMPATVNRQVRLRLANRAGTRISAVEIAAILERRRVIGRPTT
jgi:hypothetical protein